MDATARTRILVGGLKKDKEKAERSQSRRTIRGGRPSTLSGSREAKTALAGLGPDRVEARDDFSGL